MAEVLFLLLVHRTGVEDHAGHTPLRLAVCNLWECDRLSTYAGVRGCVGRGLEQGTSTPCLPCGVPTSEGEASEDGPARSTRYGAPQPGAPSEHVAPGPQLAGGPPVYCSIIYIRRTLFQPPPPPPPPAKTCISTSLRIHHYLQLLSWCAHTDMLVCRFHLYMWCLCMPSGWGQ